MRSADIRTGLTVGTIAAAATAGALAGFGARSGTPARAFNLLASVLLGDRAAGTWSFDPVATPVGALLLALVVCCYGLLFVSVVGAVVGRRLWGSAAMFAAVLCGVTLLLAPRLSGGAVGAVLQPVQIVALHLVLALGLVAGMRFAFFERSAE